MMMQEGERPLPGLLRAGLVVRRLVSFAHEGVAGPFVDMEVHRLPSRLESLLDLAYRVRVYPVVVGNEMRLDGSGHLVEIKPRRLHDAVERDRAADARHGGGGEGERAAEAEAYDADLAIGTRLLLDPLERAPDFSDGAREVEHRHELLGLLVVGRHLSMMEVWRE